LKHITLVIGIIIVVAIPIILLFTGLLGYSSSYTSMGSDKAVFLKVPAKSAKVGDIICFTVPEGNYTILDVKDWGSGNWTFSNGSFSGRNTTHRVIGYNITYDNWRVGYYLTRGDNNRTRSIHIAKEPLTLRKNCTRVWY